MSKFTLLHETPDHFVVHNGKASFHIAKKGLAEPTADKIRSFAQGGKTTFGDKTQKENQALMNEADNKIATKNYDDGGAVEQKESFELEKPEPANLEDIYKPTELPKNEAPEKRREIEADMPEPEAYAHGGKLDANARKHIAEKNFAGPDRSYPIEDASHARNALARVSQHGSPELQAQVRSKVHTKYPGIEQSKDDGGQVQSFQDSFRKATHYAKGGEADDSTLSKIGAAITNAFEKPKPTPTPPNHEAEYAKIRAQNSANMGYANGGPVASNAVKDILHETQSQAIQRYAAGNPANYDDGGTVDQLKEKQGRITQQDYDKATSNAARIDRAKQQEGRITPQNLAKGGYSHYNSGKNQVHLHFYDGAVIPTQLDKEEGAGPQQPSALDKYVGGEPASGTPLDNYADGGDVPASDSDKLAQASQDVQAGLNSQIPPASMQDTTQDSQAPAQQTIPQEQQIPAVQKPLAPTPDQQPTMLSDLDKSLAQEQSGIEQGAAAKSKGYQDIAQAIGQNALQQKAQMDAYKVASDAITAQNTQLFNAVASSKVDPNHFWNSKTGGKIAATIGVILGGIGQGLNGQPNQALATLQNHIQQDIEAQKNDQSNKTNLYKMGLEKYRDAQSAQQFATLQSNALLQGQLQKIAAQTGAPQAQATAQQLIGQLGVQNAGLRSDLAMKQAAYGAMNQPQQAGVDPNKLRLLVNAGVIPKEEVPTAMKEYGEYQKLSNSLDEVDNVFNQARKDSNYTQRISEGIPGGSMLPTFRDSTKNFQAETNALLDKYTKDLTGRVTPQSMENLRHSIPVAGDSPDVFNRKVQSFKDIVREAYNFPTLITNHVLNPNDRVIQSTATRNKKFTEGPPK